MQIKEFAAFTGVSVRTLHYYDEIGLLKPSCVEARNGYRYYDEAALLRMQEILFYRELDFSLKSIRSVLSSPNYDKAKALQEQKHLLQLKMERLEGLIAAIDSAQKGQIILEKFNNRKFEQYKQEAKERWGNTEAYKECQQKTAGQSQAQMDRTANGLMDIFKEFGTIRHLSPADPQAQALVAKLQSYITDHYYTCTTEILFGLGQMYAAGDEMNENIDAAGGEGTGAFARDAITIYCR